MINLNYRDPRPIYEQIRDSLRDMILTGALASGEKLPSVRELAVQLAINPNTIQRAYRELENAGFVYSVAGKGSFVAESDEGAAKRKQELLQQLKETAAELRRLGVSAGDIIAAVGGSDNA